MSDEDIARWLRWLGRTRAQQVAILNDLLRHARGDRMSRADRTVCLRALDRLGSPYRPHAGKAGPHHSARLDTSDTRDRAYPAPAEEMASQSY